MLEYGNVMRGKRDTNPAQQNKSEKEKHGYMEQRTTGETDGRTDGPTEWRG